ncbi:carbohydrate-binding protein, partial [Colwellia sp. BRX8-8]|nr:carbohydrate-binding protein [Colwellia sp. BRX8-8]
MSKLTLNLSALTGALSVFSKKMLSLLLLSTLISCGGGSTPTEKETINADTDNDGVFDQVDSCPNTLANTTVDASGCDIIIVSVDTDSDNDGVKDADDTCPETPDNTRVDSSGCAVIEEVVDVLVQAEDYISYFDTTASNEGGASYRNDAVDIEVTTDVGGGYNIGYTQATEWLEYPVTLSAGTYTISSRVASDSGGGNYTLSINGNTIGSDNVASTGGWQTFETQVVNSFLTTSGNFTLRLAINAGSFNINWLQITAVIDDDLDGISNDLDLCPDTLENAEINEVGCADSDGDGVFNNLDNCPDTPIGTFVDFLGCEAVEQLIEVAFNNDILVGGEDSQKPSFSLYTFDNDIGSDGSNCNDGCAVNWPPLLVTDGVASGVPNLSIINRNDGTTQAAYQGKPLYFYKGDTEKGTIEGAAIAGWNLQEYGLFGDIVPLYTSSTAQEHALIYETNDAVVTKFADRGRDRHAKEDQFQQYDHYLSHYWTHRTARYKFTDYVAKGGSSILIEWVTQ